MLVYARIKGKDRVILILGENGDKVFFIASEKVGEKHAKEVRKLIESKTSLEDKIVSLKKEFPEVYSRSLRSTNSENIKIIKEFPPKK